MNRHPINLAGKLDAFSDHWVPKIIAQMNDTGDIVDAKNAPNDVWTQ